MHLMHTTHTKVCQRRKYSRAARDGRVRSKEKSRVT